MTRKAKNQPESSKKPSNEQEVAVEMDMPEESGEMSLIDKVKMMNDLASACQNKEVIALLKSLPNGDKVYSTFKKAIEKDLNEIMNGKEDSLPNEVNSLIGAMRELTYNADRLRTFFISIMQSPLISVFNGLLQRLGEKSHSLNYESSTPQVPVQQPQAPAPQQRTQPVQPQQGQQASYDKQREEMLARKLGF
jgi:hypothetical protein